MTRWCSAASTLPITPHSQRATTATLLLDANVDIVKVKDLLGHRHVTTTQIYDKRRRSTSESASQLLAIGAAPPPRESCRSFSTYHNTCPGPELSSL